MKLPIISGIDAVKAFEKLGYVMIRQTGSHIRVTDLVFEKRGIPARVHED